MNTKASEPEPPPPPKTAHDANYEIRDEVKEAFDGFGNRALDLLADVRQSTYKQSILIQANTFVNPPATLTKETLAGSDPLLGAYIEFRLSNQGRTITFFRKFIDPPPDKQAVGNWQMFAFEFDDEVPKDITTMLTMYPFMMGDVATQPKEGDPDPEPVFEWTSAVKRGLDRMSQPGGRRRRRTRARKTRKRKTRRSRR